MYICFLNGCHILLTRQTYPQRERERERCLWVCQLCVCADYKYSSGSMGIMCTYGSQCILSFWMHWYQVFWRRMSPCPVPERASYLLFAQWVWNLPLSLKVRYCSINKLQSTCFLTACDFAYFTCWTGALGFLRCLYEQWPSSFTYSCSEFRTLSFCPYSSSPH